MPSNSPRLLFYNALLVTPAAIHDPGWLLTEGKSIKLLGSGQTTSLEPGKDADLVILSPTFDVLKTVIEGKVALA